MKGQTVQPRSGISIKMTTRGPMPRVPFDAITAVILGSNYDLSLVICGDSIAQRINKEYRKKTYRPNVLSFPISRNEGELFLNIQCAKREAKTYRTSLHKRLALLFVHGCFHLKGLDHESEKDVRKMEAAEDRILKRFGLSAPPQNKGFL